MQKISLLSARHAASRPTLIACLRKDGTEFTVKALREVRISTGNFNSPKILELLHFRSPDILGEFNTPGVVNHPNVGKNFQNHPLKGVIFEVQEFNITRDDLMRHVPEVIAAVENDQTRQLGPFIIGGNYSSALLPFPDFTKPDTCPDDRATILAATVPDYSDPSSADPATFVHSILQTPREATGGYFTHSAQEIFKGFGVESQVVDQKFSEKYIPTCAFYCTRCRAVSVTSHPPTPLSLPSWTHAI